MFNPIRREEIQALMVRVRYLYVDRQVNPDWREIGRNLLVALDHLDCAIARSTVYDFEKVIEEG